VVETINVETVLPTTAERVWQAMKQPTSFLYVCRGLFGWPALAGRTEPIREGEIGRGWLLLFHVFPMHRHTIEVLRVDEQSQVIQSHESGGLLRRWDHTLHVEPVDGRCCRYSDTVVIDAGPLTAMVARSGRAIYRYRQRRWHKLVRKHLLPSGPAYATDRRCSPPKETATTEP
jgi:hypothetical protein